MFRESSRFPIIRQNSNSPSTCDTGLRVRYRKTSRNAPAGQVFDDLGFELVGEVDGVQTLRFGLDKAIPDEQLIEVELALPPDLPAAHSIA